MTWAASVSRMIGPEIAFCKNAVTVMAASSDPQAEVSSMATPGGALRRPFVDLLLANLAPADVGFLTRIAILDDLHPELCERVVPVADTRDRLARLARDTPVFAAGEASDWLRMHALAREELRRRFAQLPADEQAALHARASEALAERGLIEAAARHALAAGRPEVAYDLAERTLYDSLIRRGQQGAVLDWLARLPQADMLHQRRAPLRLSSRKSHRHFSLAQRRTRRRSAAPANRSAADHSTGASSTAETRRSRRARVIVLSFSGRRRGRPHRTSRR